MRERKYAFILGIVAAACMVTCSEPGSAESKGTLFGWMLHTPDVLCWTTPANEVVCLPPESSAIVDSFSFNLQSKQATVTPDNRLFEDGFESLF